MFWGSMVYILRHCEYNHSMSRHSVTNSLQSFECPERNTDAVMSNVCSWKPTNSCAVIFGGTFFCSTKKVNASFRNSRATSRCVCSGSAIADPKKSKISPYVRTSGANTLR